MGRSGRHRKTRPSVLGRLTAGEAQTLLSRLLARHPELVSEAEAIARELLGDVRFEEVADQVEAALRWPGLDELNARAGASRWGYTSPDEAAWELLEEALQPFVDEMKRYAALAMAPQAQAMCQGILVGLYRVRREGSHPVLAWAPDFPEEAAAMVLKAWAEAGRRSTSAGRSAGRRPGLPADFVRTHLPEWEGMLGS